MLRLIAVFLLIICASGPKGLMIDTLVSQQIFEASDVTLDDSFENPDLDQSISSQPLTTNCFITVGIRPTQNFLLKNHYDCSGLIRAPPVLPVI